MSDLIERYGYERAVRELKAMDDRAIWMISSCLKYREEVRKECLEYRRQHNIFEVGDCVVKTNPKIKHAHVRAVISTSPSGGAVLDYQGFPYKFPCVRHATDEEITAGKRL